MPAATGPWTLPPELPNTAKQLCLVKVEQKRSGKVSYYVLRYLRGNWQFQDRLTLSSDETVVAWAYVLDDLNVG